MEIHKTNAQNLNPEQLKAATWPDRPLLIVAGAGTGKTRTLTSRIIHLIKSGVSPDKICALTFTNKAAKEMLNRIYIMLKLDSKAKPPFIGTFHSLGARMLRETGHLLGRKPNFVIFDDNDSFQLVKKIIKGIGTSESEMKPSEIYGKISMIKNGMLRAEELAASKNFDDQRVLRIFKEYEQRLLENNAFDFDDLIEKVVLVLSKRPEVLKKYQRRFSHFLVDEYQDINNVQYELVRLLASEGKNLSVVGDHNQTIYSWRGSNLDIFLNFSKDWPESTTIFLGENYRSTANIIQAASSVVKNNFQKPAGLENEELRTKNQPGKLVKIAEATDEYGEASLIINEISDYIRSGEKDIAILYRTNAQSRALEQALIESDIPYQIFGGLKFYERREIKDVLAALRYVSNPADQLSRERLEKALRKLKFARFMAAAAGKDVSAPLEIINVFLTSTDYFDYIDKNLTNPEERRENIAELIGFAGEFSNTADFLERVGLLQATDNMKKEEKRSEDFVQLMTIHLAKGLEFNSVFIAGCTEGLLPHHRSFDNSREMEEERRLAYVAMTRARKNLWMSFYNLPSRFLSEIPAELTEFAGGKALDDEERYITLD